MKAVVTSDSDALDWAAGHLPFAEQRLTYRRPWARVYTLAADSRRASLRLVQPSLIHTLKSVSVLARQFPGLVPAVIARDEAYGALLVQEQDGVAFDTDDAAQSLALLEKYADLQAAVCRLPAVLNCFPALDLDALMPALLRFLDPAADQVENPKRAGAGYFLGEKCRSYLGALAARANLIGAELKKAAGLPVTLNHGDLQPARIRWHRDDGLVIDAWDRALAGPAGLSLHALFGGCAAPAAIISGIEDDSPGEQWGHDRRLINAYIDALAQGRYATKSELKDCLPGAICAGAIRDILWYADYPDNDREYRKEVRRYLESRLSDLLDLCDLLALNDRDTAFACARDYRKNGRRRRAEGILRRYASRHRDDLQAHVRLAELLRQRGKRERAVFAYRHAISLAPDDATLSQKLGDVLQESLRFDEAEASFERARRLDGSAPGIDRRLRRLSELRRCDQDARRDDVVPTVALSESESKTKKWPPDTLALAARLFHRYGVLLIHNAFDKTCLDACYDYFIRSYAGYFSERDRADSDALNIGDRRYQISVALEGPINDPGVYANPFVLALMKKLLGDEFALGCSVCATSLPGAKDQHLHKDHRAIFTEDINGRPVALPPFAITAMVPLVPLDEEIGTTGVRKGSHLLSRQDSRELPEQLPMVPLGSCFLMDMRLSHRGLANRTDRVRPILNMVYQRYWFFDAKNFTKHPPLRVSKTEYQRIPESYRWLLAWGVQPGPQVNR